MIAAPPPLPPPAVVARPAIRFAPPLGTPLHYTSVQTFPQSGARLTIRQTLRFTPIDGGYVAALTLTAVEPEAKPQAAAAMRLLLAPAIGVETRLALDRSGAAGGLIDPEASIAAFRAGHLAVQRKITTSPAVPRSIAALSRQTLTHEIETATALDRLKTRILDLLPPGLPHLPAGSQTAFAASIATPAGAVPARGTVTLVRANSVVLEYRMALAGDPAIGRAAADRLRATLPADASPADRQRIEAAAQALAASGFTQTSDLAVAPDTGILVHLRTIVRTQAGDGSDSIISTRSIDLTP